jgi:capsular exopolysaccharide synthesis family protein
MENSKTNKGNTKEFNFQWFIANFLIHWRWFVASIILFIAIGALRLRYSVPVYGVDATIILKDTRRGGMSNSELAIFQNMSILDPNNNFYNEMEVLRSRDLLETTVINQGLFTRYFVEGRFKNTELYDSGNSGYYSGLPVRVFADSLLVSSLRGTLFLKITLADDLTILAEGSYGTQTFSQEYTSLPGVIKTPIGELFLLANERVPLKKEYPLHVQLVPPERVASQYKGMLTLSLVGGELATAVKMTLNETHRKRGEDFLNALFELYNYDTMNDKNKSAFSASKFISERLASLKEELTRAEKQLQDYKQDNHITFVQPTAGVYINEENTSSKLIADFETQLLFLDYFSEELEKENQLLPSFFEQVTSYGISLNLLEEYNRYLSDRERYLLYTKEGVPMINRLDKRLENLKIQIRKNVETVRNSLNKKKQQYEELKYEYGTDIDDIPRLDREVLELFREGDIKDKIYRELSRKQDEINLTLAATFPNAKMIEHPVAYGPILPRKMSIYLLCMIVGLLFPYLIIGIRDALNYKLSHEDEVRRFSDVPVIVSLPFVKTKAHLVVTPRSTSAIVERFRLLRTNLQFILNTPEKKSILITSAISGEGKTFISINLAMIFALKYKTVLVGLDIRRPKITNYLNLPKHSGLVSYLTGDDTNLDNLLFKNVNGTNMDVLTTGVIPPNPNELLMEKSLDNMFAELRKKYDYIVIDTSPAGSVSDAFLVDRVSDVSIFVVRKDHSPKSVLSLINNVSEGKRLKNVNIILNAFSGKGHGYGYGYGYGNYGYGSYGGYGYGGYGYGNYSYGYGYESES